MNVNTPRPTDREGARTRTGTILIIETDAEFAEDMVALLRPAFEVDVLLPAGSLELPQAPSQYSAILVGERALAAWLRYLQDTPDALSRDDLGPESESSLWDRTLILGDPDPIENQMQEGCRERFPWHSIERYPNPASLLAWLDRPLAAKSEQFHPQSVASSSKAAPKKCGRTMRPLRPQP